jgi:hypothetical protein
MKYHPSMKHLTFLLFLVLSVFANAQYCGYGYNSDEMQRFLKAKTTYVLKTGDRELDDAMQEALSAYWTVNAFQMITEKERVAEHGGQDIPVLFPQHFEVSDPSIGAGIFFQYGVMAVVLTGKSKDLGEATTLAWAHHDYMEITKPSKPYEGKHLKSQVNFTGLKYRLKDIIKGLNDVLAGVKENNLTFTQKNGKPMWSVDVPALLNKNFYNIGTATLKTKTLCVLDKNVANPDKIKKVYPYKIEFLPRDKFDQVVQGKRKDAVYMILTSSTSGPYLIITDPSTHKCLGGLTFNTGTTTVDAGDFKDLLKIIDGTGK